MGQRIVGGQSVFKTVNGFRLQSHQRTPFPPKVTQIWTLSKDFVFVGVLFL